MDAKPYNTEYTNVTWETCSFRTWLNSTLLLTAFTSAEQVAIKNSSEVSNTSYGFNKELGEDSETREAKNTVYVKGQGGWTSTFVKYADNGRWWLRSPGVDSRYAADVDYNGCCGLNGYYVNCANNAVRPALYLKH